MGLQSTWRRTRRTGGPARVADRRTRERLVRAAREVLERGGFATASVAAVAERAGVSAGALYRHFSSKAELFVDVLRAAGEGELAEMNRAATRAETSMGKLEAVVATYARRALRNRRLAWALVYEPVDPLVDAERLVFRRNYCRGMAALLRQGIAAGEFPNENPDLTAAALVGVISETLVGPLSPIGGATASEAEIVAALLRFCRRSVGVRDVPALRRVRARDVPGRVK
jgi:AcrR family transcriptional regulator